MIRAAAITAVLVAAPGATRADPWTRTDTALEVTTLATLGADLMQSTEIHNGARVLESNPMLRTGAPPVLYFAAVATAHVLATRALPQPYRRIAQILMIGVETKCVSHNWGAGYELHF